ncbi:MAG: hypothetical protein IT431_16055 [Phycisphaerales bacterium]|nr:hypothetical protein [Phycisphaerales bacterium]
MKRPAPNLLPVGLLRQRSRRRRARQWAAVLLLEASLGALAALLLRFDYDNPAKQARDAINSTIGQIDVVSGKLASARAELQGVQQKLAVAGEVASQPDWSIVLAAVARSGLGAVELSSTQLMPPVVSADGSSVHYRLALLGSSATRADVTRFVQALESCGIFSQVRIGQTQRVSGQPTGDGQDEGSHARVSFGIEAWLAEGGS